jgi:hypothetical protein
MSKLGDVLGWCAKAIPVILTVGEASSKLAKHILDTASAAQKTSDIMHDLGKSGPAKSATQDRTKPSSRPNVMDIEPAKKTELNELSTVINEQGKRLARISHRITCIGAKILKESCCNNGFLESTGRPNADRV